MTKNSAANSLTENFNTIKGFDFNLLPTFEAIYIHGSVTVAAQALDLSPSAVSQSLRKLRLRFSDPLFVRKGNSLVSTVVADSIHEALSPSFDGLLFAFKQVSEESMRNTLVVSCSPYISVRILPIISQVTKNIIPNCNIIHTVNDNLRSSVEDELIYRRADFIFDSNPYYNMSFVTEKLFEEEVALICNIDHPRLNLTLSIEQAKEEAFAMLDTDSEVVKEYQVQADLHFGGRNFCLQTPSLLSIISCVEQSDVLGIIPLWMYEKMKKTFNIKKLDTDFYIKPISFYMIYNKTSLNHKVFKEVASEISQHFKNKKMDC